MINSCRTEAREAIEAVQLPKDVRAFIVAMQRQSRWFGLSSEFKYSVKSICPGFADESFDLIGNEPPLARALGRSLNPENA